MIYFDQAATSFQKPPEVIDAVNRSFSECASIGRSGHMAAARAAELAYQTRCAAADLFESNVDQIVLTFNATHGLNIAVRSLVSPGDQVVISGFEHNAVLRPLYEIGAQITVAGTKLFDTDDTLSEFHRAVQPGVKAVICTHVSNAFGYILPVQEIADLCKERGVPFILDASQSAGVLPVSLKKLGAAFIAMPGHKGLYGPQGTGILVCGMIPKPLICGGTGSHSQTEKMPDYLPDVAEAGTHNIHGIAGLFEGLCFIQKVGLETIFKHERMLLKELCGRMDYISGIRFFHTKASCQSAVLSLVCSHMDCEIVAEKLNTHGIAVRSGLQCAPLAHRSAGTIDRGSVRVSFSYYNTVDEILEFCRVLQDIILS